VTEVKAAGGGGGDEIAGDGIDEFGLFTAAFYPTASDVIL